MLICVQKGVLWADLPQLMKFCSLDNIGQFIYFTQYGSCDCTKIKMIFFNILSDYFTSGDNPVKGSHQMWNNQEWYEKYNSNFGAVKFTIPVWVLIPYFPDSLISEAFYVLSTVRTSPIECLFFAFKNFIVNSNTFSVVPLSTYAAHSHEQTMIILRVRQKNGLLQMQYTFS